MPETTTTTAEVATWILERVEFYGLGEASSFTIDSTVEELELDSIFALTLLADIEDVYGVVIDVPVFEELSTVRELAELIVSQLAAPSE